MASARPGPFIDVPGPGIWDALRGDPTFHFDRDALGMLEADQRRWSYRYFRPFARMISRVVVVLVLVIKRLSPVGWSNHNLLDRLGIWFLSRFVSAEGGSLLLRHFVIETNILAFIARNTGLAEPGLRPGDFDDLQENAVIVHDLNLYEILAGLAGAPLVPPGDRTTPLDYSMLAVGDISVDQRRRWVQLDLETGLCFMNIAFAFLTTSGEYRRAVHSLQLDESILSILAELTGDSLFRSWSPPGFNPLIRTNRDVPRDLFVHAVIHEYIHARLLALAPIRMSGI